MVWRLVGPVLIAALASAPAAGAQAPDCPYSRCALWLVGGTTLLQGAEGTPVGSGVSAIRAALADAERVLRRDDDGREVARHPQSAIRLLKQKPRPPSPFLDD